MEGAAPAEYDPSAAEWKAQHNDHQAGPWVEVHPAKNAADGSQVSGDDWVSSGIHNDFSPRPPNQPLTQTWRIPWIWRLSGTTGAGKEFTRIDHVAYDYGAGEARLSKAGVDVRSQAADLDQWFFPQIDKNIEQIKGYFGRANYRPGYGAPWAKIETRLRKFTDMRPLADLIYTVRENAWEDPATKPAGALGLYRGLPLTDLITAAAAGWNVIEVP